MDQVYRLLLKLVSLNSATTRTWLPYSEGVVCELLLEEHAEIDFLLFLVFDELHSQVVLRRHINR